MFCIADSPHPYIIVLLVLPCRDRRTPAILRCRLTVPDRILKSAAFSLPGGLKQRLLAAVINAVIRFRLFCYYCWRKKLKLRLIYMYDSMVCTIIDVDELERVVEIRNYTKNPLMRAASMSASTL